MKCLSVVAVLALAAVSVEAGCYPEGAERPATLTYEEKLALAVNHVPLEAENGHGHHHERLPSHFDWENVDGINYLAPSWNQHIPKYCGSCWLHATLSSMNDRIKIANHGKGPDVMLSRQVVLQCGMLANMSNGCNGGEPRNVFDFMHEYGLPDETCMLYKADDQEFMHLKKEGKQCPHEGFCMNCMKGHKPECWAIEKPLSYRVSSYGPVEPTEHAIMNEVHKRGPVVCSIATCEDFDYNYHGGVYLNTKNATDVNHDIEIVGWGVDDDGTPYWRCRNSWGTYWGEKGFFKVRRGTNELNIEDDCWYAIPDVTMQRELDEGKLVGDMVIGIIKNPKWEAIEKKIKEIEEKEAKEEEEMKKEMKERFEERQKALEKIHEEMEKMREEQKEEYAERIRERIQRLREKAERRHRWQQEQEEEIAERMHEREQVQYAGEGPTGVRLGAAIH